MSRKQNPWDFRKHDAIYNTPGKKGNCSNDTKNTRFISFRLPLYLDDAWREAIFMSGHTQTQILVNLIESYIKYQNGINKPVDETINQLMEKRERNDRNIVANTIDDAIRRMDELKARQKEAEEDD
jgi:hypothetical protein